MERCDCVTIYFVLHCSVTVYRKFDCFILFYVYGTYYLKSIVIVHWMNKSIRYPVWCCWLITLHSYSYTVKVHDFCQMCGAMVWHSWKHSTINKADLTVCCKLSNYLKSIVIVHWVNEPNTCQFDRMRDAQLLNVVVELATLPHTTHDKDQVVYINI